MEISELIKIAEAHPKLTLDELRSIGSADYKWEENNELFLLRYVEGWKIGVLMDKYGLSEAGIWKKIRSHKDKLARFAGKQ